jgi:hypothetical protein
MLIRKCKVLITNEFKLKFFVLKFMGGQSACPAGRQGFAPIN